jgi:preprotein translocase subunit SecD
MLNRYPLWKNLTVVLVTVFAVFFAWPNIYPKAPALDVTRIGTNVVPKGTLKRLRRVLDEARLPVLAVRRERHSAVVVFRAPATQRRALVLLKHRLGDDFSVAPNLVTLLPGWMRALGLRPMPEGLDLRGGIYFLLSVDTHAARHEALGNDRSEAEALLRRHNVRFRSVTLRPNGLEVELLDPEAIAPARRLLRHRFANAAVSTLPGTRPALFVRFPPSVLDALDRQAVRQDVSALRRRVDELGVAAAVVEQQGRRHVVVELPGIEDAARAKRRLGDTATVQFRMVYTGSNAYAALERGVAPPGTRLFHTTNGTPVLLDRAVVVGGRHIDNATATYVHGLPAVNVTLDSLGGARMLKATSHNVGKPMAVLYIENRSERRTVDGVRLTVVKKIERVINVATIRGVFSSNFQITGLGQREANKLALLLRTPLAAPMTVVAERTIGPSLGRANIRDGIAAVVLGFALVLLFMALYYRVFGLIADVALVINFFLTVALLSLIHATLTLPGIAGLVLTAGMAIDANVLIYERVREELRNGSTPQAAIHAGYEHAWATIWDSHVTTLIAAVALFFLGNGPVKGFAVTLTFGIITSLYTAVMTSRAITNWLFGGRRLTRLPV